MLAGFTRQRLKPSSNKNSLDKAKMTRTFSVQKLLSSLAFPFYQLDFN